MIEIPDAERLAVAWLKSRALDDLEDQIATALPAKGWTTFATVQQIDAGYSDEDGVVIADLQWDVRARTSSESASSRPPWPQAKRVADALVAEMHDAQRVTVADIGYIYLFGQLRGPQRFADEEPSFARYLVLGSMVFRALT